MKKWLAFVLICSTLWVTGCSAPKETSEAKPTELIVFAASSLTDVFRQQAEAFEDKHQDVEIVFNFGASGALQTQIAQGAPCDIFASAGQKQMEGLAEKDLLLPESVQTFARNQLVVIAPKNSSLTVADLNDVLQPDVKQIAIGDPGSVPAGQYSVEALTNQQIIESVQDKLVYTNNVRQAVQYVESGEVELGFVYATDAAISKQVKVLFAVPEESHAPITYPIGVIKESANQAVAMELIEWIQSKQGQKVLQEYGFTPVQ